MLQLQSSQPRPRVRLVAFDVDGTLLRGPTICECIAAGIGKQEEMRTFERLTSDQDIATARAAMVACWCDDDTIAHFWPEDKATWLAQRAVKLGLSPAQVAAVGDSASDLPMLRYAGIGYFVGRGAEPLPANVKRCPAADIREIARDICGDRPRATNIDKLQKQ